MHPLTLLRPQVLSPACQWPSECSLLIISMALQTPPGQTLAPQRPALLGSRFLFLISVEISFLYNLLNYKFNKKFPIFLH